MADIGVRIGVDGEKQFKQQIQNCTQAGKTLDAQMKSLASSFGKAENEEESYSKASKILSDQVSNQKRTVDTLNKAVAESSEKYGENSTKTLKLKEQLAKAETQLNKLEGQTVESALGMDNMADSEVEVAKGADKASGKVSAFTVALGSLMADAIKAGFKFMVDSVKKIAKYFVDATKGAAEYADEIMELSAQTSISTEKLQEYKYMASLTDTSLETITGSMTKLTKTMFNAQGGSKSAVESFESLGIAVTDSNGELRSADSVFQEAITALGQISNETERDALAMQIFGKSAKDLNPLIEAGGDALEEFRKEAHDVGYILDDETLESLGAVQDGFDRLGLAADSAKNQIGAALGQFILPYLEKLVSAVQMLVGQHDVEGFVNAISEVLNNLVGTLASVLPDVLKAGGQIVGQLVMGITQMLPSLVPAAVDLISQFAMFIIQNLPTIVNTAVEIIIALANGIAEQIPVLIPAAIEAVLTIAEGLLSHIGDIISAALALIDGIVQGLTSDEGINAIIDAIPTLILALIEGILDNLPKIIASGVNIIVNLIVGLIKAIPKIIQAIPQIIKAIIEAFKNFEWSSLGSNIINGISDGVKNTASNIWTAVKNAFETAVNWIKNLGSQALNWGSDMINGFVNGIKEKAQKLLDSIKSIAEKIKGFLHFSRPDFGPLRDYEKWMPDFMEGLANGIERNAWRVEDAMRGVTADIAGGVNMGGVAITVNAAQGQNEEQIARNVIRILNNQVNARRAVFA